MERVGLCNLCGSRRSNPYVAGQDRIHGVDGVFQLVRCTGCGLIYLDPRPRLAEMARFYPDDYASYTASSVEERSWLRRLDRKAGINSLCRAVGRVAKRPGCILDIGCATGNFLAGMRTRGWETWGVEPNHFAAGYARDQLQLDVREGTLEQATFPSGFFDVVTMWHVLEHVHDPRATLDEVSRILKPGGWLVITVPHLESWEARIFGPYWVGLDIPRHLFLFTRLVMRRYLADAGFEYAMDRCITGRHVGLITSIRFWSTDWRLAERTRQKVVGFVNSLLARILTWPYYRLTGLLKRGSFITTFARKRETLQETPI